MINISAKHPIKRYKKLPKNSNTKFFIPIPLLKLVVIIPQKLK